MGVAVEFLWQAWAAVLQKMPRSNQRLPVNAVADPRGECKIHQMPGLRHWSREEVWGLPR